MKIDFSTRLKNFDGTDAEEDKKPLVLASVCVNSLLGVYSDEQQLPGTEKAKRYELALKIKDGGTIDLPVEDIAKLKELVGKAYAPIVVGQAYKMLETSA